jgi:flagellar motility protein MotE (MotC chaperone)
MKNTGGIKGIPLKILLLPVIFLVLFKIAFSFISSENSFMDGPGLLLTTADVSAQEKTEEPFKDNPEPEKPEVESSAVIESSGTDEFSFGKWGPDFINDLKLRDDQITRRKDVLEIQEMNLKKLKNQIEERIEQLVKVEKAISVLIAQKEQIESEKMKKLARVFEATPPEQAGILMSKLDVDIAADLLVKMNGRKAGKIWGYVVPDRAVLISNRLSEINPDFKIEAQK